jgi:hypothetical protein
MHLKVDKKRRKGMAYPIELGLVLKGEDAEAFLEDIRNPTPASDEEVSIFKEAIKIYSLHRV